MSEFPTEPVPAFARNCATRRGRSRLARALHAERVANGMLLALLMCSACVFPPSLSVDTTDAAINSAPAIVSIRADGVELPEFFRVTFERGRGTLNLTLHDTDLTDTLYAKVFVDYNRPDKTPPRANCQTAGNTVQRTCTLDLAGLCLSADINIERVMQVLVFDRQVLDTGEPLHQAMPPGGLSTSRTLFLYCVEQQQL